MANTYLNRLKQKSKLLRNIRKDDDMILDAEIQLIISKTSLLPARRRQEMLIQKISQLQAKKAKEIENAHK